MTEDTSNAAVHTAVTMSTPLGALTLVANRDALIGLFWPEQRFRNHFPTWEVVKQIDDLDTVSDEVLIRATSELEEYFSGRRVQFDVPLAPAGNAMQRSVWDALCDIPFGETTTYGDIARELGNPHLAQQVGQAVGANPIGLIIPCHRVVGRDGSLTGFSGGLERKRWLLQFEDPGPRAEGRLF